MKRVQIVEIATGRKLNIVLDPGDAAIPPAGCRYEPDDGRPMYEPPRTNRVWDVAELFEVMTDAEFLRWEARAKTMPARRQARFNHRETLREGRPGTAEVIALMEAEFGKARAWELLDAAEAR